MCVNKLDEDTSLTRTTAEQPDLSPRGHLPEARHGKPVLYLNFGAVLCNSGRSGRTAVLESDGQVLWPLARSCHRAACRVRCVYSRRCLELTWSWRDVIADR